MIVGGDGISQMADGNFAASPGAGSCLASGRQEGPDPWTPVLYAVGTHAPIDDNYGVKFASEYTVTSPLILPPDSPLPTVTMATSSAPKLRSLYRSFLRELPPRPILAKQRSPLHQRLREHFHPETTTLGPGEQAVAQAEQYLAYVQAQRTYVTLLERYNPGMGVDEEERVRLTAKRVGMDLPVEYGKKK